MFFVLLLPRLLKLVGRSSNHLQKLLLFHVIYGLLLDFKLIDLSLGQMVKGDLSSLPVSQDYLGSGVSIRLTSFF